MDRPALSGQRSVEERLRQAAMRRALPHALIFSGSGDRLSAALFAAASLECTAGENRPCGTCQDCRKVFAGIHPDVIRIHDNEHKILPVETLRSARQDAHIRPNEAERKIYLFDDCAQLDERGQNILLKVVEEGPPYAVFLFCTENAGALLPTLRSRCMEVKLQPEETEKRQETLRTAELCRRIARRSAPGLTRYLVSLETARCKREELGTMLEESRVLFAAALLTLYGLPCSKEQQEIVSNITENLTKGQIMRTIEVLQTYCNECEWNIGPGHVLGALAVELEGIL